MRNKLMLIVTFVSLLGVFLTVGCRASLELGDKHSDLRTASFQLA